MSIKMFFPIKNYYYYYYYYYYLQLAKEVTGEDEGKG
mgnify:CR=1 FL=1